MKFFLRMNQFGWKVEQMPARKAGGLYKINCPEWKTGFVEAAASRAFRDAAGTVPGKMSYHLTFPAFV